MRLHSLLMKRGHKSGKWLRKKGRILFCFFRHLVVLESEVTFRKCRLVAPILIGEVCQTDTKIARPVQKGFLGGRAM